MFFLTTTTTHTHTHTHKHTQKKGIMRRSKVVDFYKTVLFSSLITLKKDTTRLKDRYKDVSKSYDDLSDEVTKKIKGKGNGANNKVDQFAFSTRINHFSILYGVINLALNEYKYAKSSKANYFDKDTVFNYLIQNLKRVSSDLVVFLNIRKRKKSFRIYEHADKGIQTQINKVFIDLEKFIDDMSLVVNIKKVVANNKDKSNNGDKAILDLIEKHKKTDLSVETKYENEKKYMKKQKDLRKQKNLREDEKNKVLVLESVILDTDKENRNLRKTLSKYKDSLRDLRELYSKRNERFEETKYKNVILKEELDYTMGRLNSLDFNKSYAKGAELLKKKIGALSKELEKYTHEKRDITMVTTLKEDVTDLKGLLKVTLENYSTLLSKSGELESDMLSNAEYKKLYNYYAPKAKDLQAQVMKLNTRVSALDTTYNSASEELGVRASSYILDKFRDIRTKSTTAEEEKQMDSKVLMKIIKAHEKDNEKEINRRTRKGKMIEAYISNISSKNALGLFKTDILNKAVEDQKAKKDLQSVGDLTQNKIGGIFNLILSNTPIPFGGTVGTVMDYGLSQGMMMYGDKQRSNERELERQGLVNESMLIREERDNARKHSDLLAEQKKTEVANNNRNWFLREVTGLEIPGSMDEVLEYGFKKILHLPKIYLDKRAKRKEMEKQSLKIREAMTKGTYEKVMDLAINDDSVNILLLNENPEISLAFQLMTENNVSLKMDDIVRSKLDFNMVLECHLDIRRSIKLKILNTFRNRPNHYVYLKELFEACDVFQFIVGYVVLSRNFRKLFIDKYKETEHVKPDVYLPMVVYILLDLYLKSSEYTKESRRTDMTFIEKIDHFDQRGFYLKDFTVYDLVIQRSSSFHYKLKQEEKIDDLDFKSNIWSSNAEAYDDDDVKVKHQEVKKKLEIIIERIINMDAFKLSRIIFFASPLFTFISRFKQFHNTPKDECEYNLTTIFGDGYNIFSSIDDLCNIMEKKDKHTKFDAYAKGDFFEKFRDTDMDVYKSVMTIKMKQLKVQHTTEHEDGKDEEHTIARIPYNGILWMALTLLYILSGDIKKEIMKGKGKEKEKGMGNILGTLGEMNGEHIYYPDEQMLLFSKSYIDPIDLFKDILNKLTGDTAYYKNNFEFKLGRAYNCNGGKKVTKHVSRFQTVTTMSKNVNQVEEKTTTVETPIKHIHMLKESVKTIDRLATFPVKYEGSDTHSCGSYTPETTFAILLTVPKFIIIVPEKSDRNTVTDYDTLGYKDQFNREFTPRYVCLYDTQKKKFVFLARNDEKTRGFFSWFRGKNKTSWIVIEDHKMHANNAAEVSKYEHYETRFIIYEKKKPPSTKGSDEKTDKQIKIEVDGLSKKFQLNIDEIQLKIGSSMSLGDRLERVKKNLRTKLEEENYREYANEKKRVQILLRVCDRKIKTIEEASEGKRKRQMALNLTIKKRDIEVAKAFKWIVENEEKKDTEEYRIFYKGLTSLNERLVHEKVERNGLDVELKVYNEKLHKCKKRRVSIQNKHRDKLERLIKLREEEDRMKMELDEERVRKFQDEHNREIEANKRKIEEENRRVEIEKNKAKRVVENKKLEEQKKKDIAKLRAKAEQTRRKEMLAIKREEKELKREADRDKKEEARSMRTLREQQMRDRKRDLDKRERAAKSVYDKSIKDLVKKEEALVNKNKQITGANEFSTPYWVKKVDVWATFAGSTQTKLKRTMEAAAKAEKRELQESEDMRKEWVGVKIGDEINGVKLIVHYPIELYNDKYTMLKLDGYDKTLTLISETPNLVGVKSYGLGLSFIKLFESDEHLSICVIFGVGTEMTKFVFLNNNDYDGFVTNIKQLGVEIIKIPTKVEVIVEEEEEDQTTEIVVVPKMKTDVLVVKVEEEPKKTKGVEYDDIVNFMFNNNNNNNNQNDGRNKEEGKFVLKRQYI